METLDLSLVDWSRAQFALTAIYHWLFVPLTLGLGVIISVMETYYYKTGDEEWKRITQFWMKLFGINFQHDHLFWRNNRSKLSLNNPNQ